MDFYTLILYKDTVRTLLTFLFEMTLTPSAHHAYGSRPFTAVRHRSHLTGSVSSP